MTTRILYDLAGAEDDRRFSPYCWRIRLALAHKGLVAETRPWRFTEKDAIAVSGQDKVPVLVDGDRVISDSWAIATYLEERYPDRPSLFGGAHGRAMTRFLNLWADRVLAPAIARMIVADIHRHLHEKDQAYFRMSREQRFGMALEDVVVDRDRGVVAFRQALDPLRALVGEQPFAGGLSPSYADYIAFSCFQWAGATSRFALLAAEDPLVPWRDRIADLFDGLARDGLKPPLY